MLIFETIHQKQYKKVTHTQTTLSQVFLTSYQKYDFELYLYLCHLSCQISAEEKIKFNARLVSSNKTCQKRRSFLNSEYTVVSHYFKSLSMIPPRRQQVSGNNFNYKEEQKTKNYILPGANFIPIQTENGMQPW